MPFGFGSSDPSGPAVLIVEPDDRMRSRLCSAFAERLVPTFDVPQAFDAMNSLGRADFGAVVVREGKRRLSVRGLLQLALRSHPDIYIVVLSEHPRDEVAQGLGIEVETFGNASDAYDIAASVASAMDERAASIIDADTDVMTRPGVTPPGVPQPVTMPSQEAAGPSEEGIFNEPALDFERVAAEFEDPGFGFVEDPVDQTTRNPIAPSFEEPTYGDKTFSVSQPPELSVPNEAVMPAPGLASDTSPGMPFRSLQALAFEAGSASDQTAEFDALQIPLLEGDLEGRAGCPLLITLSARELTGRLQVEGGAGAGALYFFRGDPVAAEADDVEVIREKARALGIDLQGVVVEDGDDLVSVLAESGRVPGDKVHQLLLGFLRERVFAVASQDTGGYAFFEEDAFVRQRPMIRVNAFGMVLDSRRRRTPPGELLNLASELEAKRVRPLPPLDLASHQLLPFTRDVDLASTIGVGLFFKSFLEMTGLDPMMGALVILAMEDARLVEVGGADFDENTARIPLASSVNRLQAPMSGFGGGTAEVLEPLNNRAARIRALAEELGDATEPSEVLGVPPGATPSEIREAYDARMRTVGALFLDESGDATLKVEAVALNHRLRRAYRSLIQ